MENINGINYAQNVQGIQQPSFQGNGAQKYYVSSPIEQKEDGDKKLMGALAGLAVLGATAGGLVWAAKTGRLNKIKPSEIAEGLKEGIAKNKDGKAITGTVVDGDITRRFINGQCVYKKEETKVGENLVTTISNYDKTGKKLSRTINGMAVKLDETGHALYHGANKERVQLVEDGKFFNLTTGKTGQYTNGIKFEPKNAAQATKNNIAETVSDQIPPMETAQKNNATDVAKEAIQTHTDKDGNAILNSAEESARVFSANQSRFTIEQIQNAEKKAVDKKQRATEALEKLQQRKEELNKKTPTGRNKRAQQKAINAQLKTIEEKIKASSAEFYSADEAIQRIGAYKKTHCFM